MIFGMQVELVNSTSCLKLSFSRLGRDNGDLGRENHDFMYLHYFLIANKDLEKPLLQPCQNGHKYPHHANCLQEYESYGTQLGISYMALWGFGAKSLSGWSGYP